MGRPGDGTGVSSGLAAIAAAGVVVPAHNEEVLLPACLAALRRTASALQVPVFLLVVADMCSDRTAAVARAEGAQVISIQARRVGAARAAGMRELLRLMSGSDPSAVWLATRGLSNLLRTLADRRGFRPQRPVGRGTP
jgi:glycosyltransferase involved in cell wall biosynthesis